MRVLHVNNVAGVSSLLVRGLRDRGLQANLIVHSRHPYAFPHEKVLNVSSIAFKLHVLKLSSKYNLIHMNSLSYRICNVDLFPLKASRAKLLVHLHGTELRRSYSKLSTKAALRISNEVLVGTPDLLRYYPRAVWLPTPIDPVFKHLDNPQRVGKALYLRKWYEPEMEKMVRLECKKKGLELTVLSKPILYKKMPLFLNRFEAFFDRFTIPSLSKTALEAMACGCKIISWKGLITNPEEILKKHSLKVVTEKLLDTYTKLLQQ